MQRSLPIKTDESVRHAETSDRGDFFDVHEERNKKQQRRYIKQKQISGERPLDDADHETAEEIIDEYAQTPGRGEGQRLQSDKLDMRVTY